MIHLPSCENKTHRAAEHRLIGHLHRAAKNASSLAGPDGATGSAAGAGPVRYRLCVIGSYHPLSTFDQPIADLLR